jgi:competence protein ComEC
MLKMHFLNVGKGNCTIIEFPSGRLSMIDIDNSRTDNNEEALTDPVLYFHTNFQNQILFRFILTHPDMDHMSGLYKLAQGTQIQNFWDTEHNKTFHEEDWEGSPYYRGDWEQYLKFRKSLETARCLKLYRNETSDCCWIRDGIRILSPSSYLTNLSACASDNDPQKYNHLSYVLMMNYAGTRVLLGGDASCQAWEDILRECGEESLKADIFLAPHHGSRNNIHRDAFEAISPDYVIISVATGTDYDYQYYSQLAARGVLSTKYYGTVMLKIENGKCFIFPERNYE